MGGTDRIDGSHGASLAALYLPEDASAQDVRHAFRSLMRQLHPDTSGATAGPTQLTSVVDAYHDLAAAGFLDENPGSGIRRNGQLVDIRA